ncbi:MAG: DUF2807 domain-containing protein [Bacteroidetes bacterium]|nr:DUF2807 domain-containing protein [Bacteroidota bacterium]
MKYTYLFNTMIALLCAVSFSSCERDVLGCIRGEGPAVTESRSISGFTKVDMQGDAEITIVEDTGFSVILDGQQNIIDNLRLNVDGEILVIRQRHCVRHKSNLNIRIHMPSVREIILNGSSNIHVFKTNNNNLPTSKYAINGSGNITVNGDILATNLYANINGSGKLDLNAKVMWCSFNINGSGKIICEGSTNSADNFITGSGKIQTFNYLAKDSYVKISGSGNAEVNVSDNLDVDITGSGNVKYRGWPKVNSHISGSGSVEHEN